MSEDSEVLTKDPITSAAVGDDESTLFVRDVTKIDCATFDPASGVSGQSWHVDIAVSGTLDDNGFVVDFSPLKSLVAQVLKSTIDHALLLPVGSQMVQYSETNTGEHWRLHAKARMSQTDCTWDYLCPKGAVFPIRAIALKTNVVEQEIARILRHRLPETIRHISIKLREEKTKPTEATYRYTHGIKGHGGLCQRLLHGHRSRLEVHIGEERRPDLEHFVAREIFGSNVHIATLDQIKSGNGEVGYRSKKDDPLTLAFTGSLGSYEVTLPSSRVFFVERETSVECIAKQIALVIKREESPKERVRVVCFEGINKGAVAEA
jgi:6-pyruvoyl-tetrahydropterin synthase